MGFGLRLKRREFSGKEYQLDSAWGSKRTAMSRAENLRRAGKLARVTGGTTDWWGGDSSATWEVWARWR